MTASERDLIERIRDAFGTAGVAPGAWSFSDDAALMPPLLHPRGTRIVTTDVVVEGIDFDRALYPLHYAGARALAQNLSDVAAMGATPVGFVWTLSIPPADTGAALDELMDLMDFVRGAAALAKTRRVPLLGGDLSSTTERGPLTCSITAFGDVDGQPVKRSGAKVGDGVWLTSPVGAAAAGLRRLRARGAAAAPFDAWLRALPDSDARAVRAHICPLPPDGAPLAGRATACIDVSDGLAIDAHRLAAASNVRLELDALAAAAVAAGATRDEALHGGEDYALLFTLPAAMAPPIEAVRIGRVVEGSGVWADGVAIAPRGFDHFNKST